MGYQISVSLNGQFLFRTDVEHDLNKVKANVTMLSYALPLATICVIKHIVKLHSMPADEFFKQHPEVTS